MAQATLEYTMNREAAPSVAFIIARNGDPLTLALRSEEELDDGDILLLNKASSSTSTSVGSAPSALYSSHEPSIGTKPTSYSTEYPTHDYTGRGKIQAEYSSSLSASQGSESESEPDQEDSRGNALLGTGAWSFSQHDHDRCLRREENAKVRLSKLLPDRKKPPVILHQSTTSKGLSFRDGISRSNPTSEQEKKNQCPRHHIPKQHYVIFGSMCIMVLTGFLGGILVGRGSLSSVPLSA